MISRPTSGRSPESPSSRCGRSCRATGPPTHDPGEIRTRLAEDRRYLELLRADVEAYVAAGASLDETASRCAAVPLRRGEDDAETHRLNVEKVYSDLGGDADPEEVGFARAWKEATGT